MLRKRYRQGGKANAFVVRVIKNGTMVHFRSNPKKQYSSYKGTLVRTHRRKR